MLWGGKSTKKRGIVAAKRPKRHKRDFDHEKTRRQKEDQKNLLLIGPSPFISCDGDQVVAECDYSGRMLSEFVYGPGIDEPLIMIIPAGQTNPGWYWYHYDGLGSVVALSDSSGSIVEAYSYDVFGAVKVHTGPGANGIWLTTDDDFNTPVDKSAYGSRVESATGNAGTR